MNRSMAFLMTRTAAPVWLVFSAALFLTFWIWDISRQAEAQSLEDHFEKRTDEIKLAIVDRIKDDIQVMRGAQGLFAASERVTRGEWHRYVEELRMD